MDKIIKNKKDLELITSLFELQNMFEKVPSLVWPFESGNCGKKKKTKKKTLHMSRMERAF